MVQKTYPLKVQKKIRECENACTLVLSPKEEDRAVFFPYKPAQFLTFCLNIQGQSIFRSYSLSCSPLLDEPLTTTIKKVPQGRVSTYLVDEIQENDVIQSTKPQGRFFKMPESLKSYHYLMVAGGSGITPLFSIIKTALFSDSQNKITLVYCNRSQNSVIYKKELEELSLRHSSRFKIFYVLSRPEEKDKYDFKGRLQEHDFLNILKQTMNLDSHQMEFYLCGPLNLMKMSEKAILSLGAEKKQIRKESFGVSLPPKVPKAPDSALVIHADSPPKPVQPLQTIQAYLDGEKIEIPAREGVSVLEQLTDAGHAPPFSCMEGSCMTCLAVLKKGSIYQNEAGILDDENISAKEILTCQAKPLSAVVEVDYDS